MVENNAAPNKAPNLKAHIHQTILYHAMQLQIIKPMRCVTAIVPWAVWKNQSILHHKELEGNGMTSGCCADGWCCFSRGYRLETEKVSPERPPAWGHLAGETHGRRNAAEVKIVVHLSDDDSIWFIWSLFRFRFCFADLRKVYCLAELYAPSLLSQFFESPTHTHIIWTRMFNWQSCLDFRKCKEFHCSE